ncbi:hypothetical protein VTK26DRAFT_3805 [Humicola hyalothermophila]
MGKSSIKRERTSDEDAVDNHDVKPALKKSKLDSAGKAAVTKKRSESKEPKSEPIVAEDESRTKKNKKEKKEKKKDKKGKKDKKDKEKKSSGEELTTEPIEESVAPEPTSTDGATNSQTAEKESTDSATKKSKKQKKKKKNKPAAAEQEQPEGQDQEDPQQQQQQQQQQQSNGKPARFICFVGNLPFTATAESVRAHFATLHPTSVRLLTQRDDPLKSRGIAFVEFGRFDHMKTCLEKFHHTEFNDGKSPARRINVELTAGGGGKTAARRDKIKQKNAKLNEERAQRLKKEEEAKQARVKTQEEREEDAIHPSRRARVPYNRK